MPKTIRDNTNKRKGPYEKQGAKVQERFVVQIDGGQNFNISMNLKLKDSIQLMREEIGKLTEYPEDAFAFFVSNENTDEPHPLRHYYEFREACTISAIPINTGIVDDYMLPNEDFVRFEVKQGIKEDSLDYKEYKTKEKAEEAKEIYERDGPPELAFSPVVSPRIGSPVGPPLITPNNPYNWRNPELNPPIDRVPFYVPANTE
jgi:hypothetical protein